MLDAGTVLAGRYEILETLGEGGMGAVYKAKDLELNRMVALKVIRPELAKNPAIIDRFKQELLLSQRVTHRNVIRIYDLGEGDGVKFITMEFIEGHDLRSLIHERKKVTPEEAVAADLTRSKVAPASPEVVAWRDLAMADRDLLLPRPTQ